MDKNLLNINSKKNIFLTIIFLSLFFHFFFYYFRNDHNIITFDSWEYLALAESLRNNFSYSIDNVLQMNRGPGYPIFIFISKLFYNNNISVILLQIFIYTVSLLMITDIVLKINKYFTKKKLFFFIIFLVINIYSINYNFLIMSESFYSFCIVFSLWSLTIKEKNAKKKLFFNTSKLGFFLFGVSSSVCILTRQVSLMSYSIFFLLVFLSILIIDKKNFFNYLKNISFFLISFFLILSIWCIRNYVYFKDEILINQNATIIGYKTNISTYNHYYDKRFKKYLFSNDQPFFMIRPYQKPVSVNYKYKDEKKDVEYAFSKLENDIKISKLSFANDSTLDFFEKIAKKRFEADPLLYFTAPFSRAIKLLFSPRIGAIDQKGETGYSTSNFKFLTLFLLNLIYLIIFIQGLIYLLREKLFLNRENFYTLLSILFVFSFVIGHLYSYSVLFPFAQSRYLIPVIPLYLIFFRIK